MKGRIYHNGLEYMINLHPTNAEIILRPWTRYVPWDVHKGMVKNGIPVSEFGGRNPKQFIERIGLFAPHLGL